jgi:hypothetical protein
MLLDAAAGAAPPARYFADSNIDRAITRISAHAGDITLIVGAGASMEADLPAWNVLVRRVLAAYAPKRLSVAEREEWMDAIEAEGPLAAAAVAKAMSPDDEHFAAHIRQALYGERTPSSYRPQALARQIAWLKRLMGSRLRIVTANYDGLLEQALRDEGLTVQSYVIARAERARSAAVYHLHGRLVPSYPATGQLVLAEDDYARVQWTGSWQDRFMRQSLEESLCVFVGLSFTDPNLIRWLYRYSQERTGPSQHLVLFTRQGGTLHSRTVRTNLERAAAERWRRCGVEALWCNFFGETAQFVHEIGVRLTPEQPDFHTRAAARLSSFRDTFLPEDGTAFRARQDSLSRLLGRFLMAVKDIALSAGVELSDEDLGLGLWVVDHGQGVVGCVATADRRFNDARTVVWNQLELESRWIAVEAVTRGVVVQRDPELFASRWRLIRGVPLVLAGENGTGRNIVGAMTLTSTTPETQSKLRAVPRGTLGQIDRLLEGASLLFE